MPRSKRSQLLPAVRVPPEQSEWLARQARARNIERSTFVRQVFEESRTRFGLPPTDLDALEEKAARQRLDLHRFIGEVLRGKARELRAGAAVALDAGAHTKPPMSTEAPRTAA